jgi:hypothetical protein
VTYSLRTRRTTVVVIALVALLGLLAFRGVASGTVPPTPPDFSTVFGPVQLDGQNLQTSEQTLIAMVNGQACGHTATQVASDDPSNEPDIGKTVFAVNVMANGSGFSQVPGCGTNGDIIHFYLPEEHRLATETSVFSGVGFQRQELTLDAELVNRLPVPLVTADKN